MPDIFWLGHWQKRLELTRGYAVLLAMRVLYQLPITIAIAYLGLQVSVQADPAGDLARFSGLPNPDIGAVVGGKVLTSSGKGSGQGRDLAVEALYFLPLPVEKSVEHLRRWNGTNYPELEVYLHGIVSAQPGAADFRKISSAPATGPVRALVANTVMLDPQMPQLHVSREEAQRAPRSASASAMTPEVAAFWGEILAGRARAFRSSGLSGQPPYFFNGEKVQVSAEVSRLLRSQGKWQSQFAPVLGAASLNSGGGGKFSLYWTMFDVEGQAALALGGFLAQGGAGGTSQAIDLQYYASAGHYALVTLYQLWPVKGGTLVWRGDLVSAPGLSALRGVERLASRSVMVKTISKSINRLKQDARR